MKTIYKTMLMVHFLLITVKLNAQEKYFVGLSLSNNIITNKAIKRIDNNKTNFTDGFVINTEFGKIVPLKKNSLYVSAGINFEKYMFDKSAPKFGIPENQQYYNFRVNTYALALKATYNFHLKNNYIFFTGANINKPILTKENVSAIEYDGFKDEEVKQTVKNETKNVVSDFRNVNMYINVGFQKRIKNFAISTAFLLPLTTINVNEMFYSEYFDNEAHRNLKFQVGLNYFLYSKPKSL